MLTLIHGEDTVASRKQLSEEKEKGTGQDLITLEGVKLQYNDIILATQSSSLFANTRIVVIENLLFGGLSKAKIEIINYLTSKECRVDIILWEKTEITKVVITKYFSSAKVFSFKFPTSLFKFLDIIGTTTSSQLLVSFHGALKNSNTELTFALLLRLFRNLIIVKDLGNLAIEELPSWQLNKFISQSRYFTFEGLISSYRKLLSIDFKIKNSQTPYNLSQLLDIFFVTL